jgi:hypothetical protein
VASFLLGKIAMMHNTFLILGVADYCENPIVPTFQMIVLQRFSAFGSVMMRPLTLGQPDNPYISGSSSE